MQGVGVLEDTALRLENFFPASNFSPFDLPFTASFQSQTSLQTKPTLSHSQ